MALFGTCLHDIDDDEYDEWDFPSKAIGVNGGLNDRKNSCKHKTTKKVGNHVKSK